MTYLRLAPYAAIVGAVLFIWWLWSDRQAQIASVERLERAAAVQAEVLQQEREGRKVADATIARLTQSRAELNVIRSEIRKGGRDASNVVDLTIERLRNRRSGNR